MVLCVSLYEKDEIHFLIPTFIYNVRTQSKNHKILILDSAVIHDQVQLFFGGLVFHYFMSLQVVYHKRRGIIYPLPLSFSINIRRHHTSTRIYHPQTIQPYRIEIISITKFLRYQVGKLQIHSVVHDQGSNSFRRRRHQYFQMRYRI